MKNLYSVILVLALFGTPAMANVGKVVHVNGEVFRVDRAGNSQAAKPKMILETGDSLKTGNKSLVVFSIKDLATHKLGENSLFKVTAPVEKGLVELITGSLFSLVVKKKQKSGVHYRIKTRAAVAGVRGTQFFVSYGGKSRPSDAWVCVNEGEVEVSSLVSKSKVLVKEGFGVSVKGAAVSAPAQLPWTRKLNWNMDSSKGELQNPVSIDEAYGDLLDVDYD